MAPLAAAATAPGTATPLTSKLQRTPAWMHREQEGLSRSQRRLKWRQRSHVLTSRIWGMLFFHTKQEQSMGGSQSWPVQESDDECLAFE